MPARAFFCAVATCSRIELCQEPPRQTIVRPVILYLWIEFFHGRLARNIILLLKQDGKPIDVYAPNSRNRHHNCHSDHPFASPALRLNLKGACFGNRVLWFCWRLSGRLPVRAGLPCVRDIFCSIATSIGATQGL